MRKNTKFISAALAIFCALTAGILSAQAQTSPNVRIVLPERFRVLTGQYFDLRIEAESISSLNGRLQISIENENGRRENFNVTGNTEITSNNDNNANTLDRAFTYRRVSFNTPGIKTIQATLSDGRRTYGFSTQISVQNFDLVGQKNIVLYIGDAMGQAYRDSSRIVAQSTGNRFREGFFDELQEMDKMPVTGTYMTYALDQIVPDSANSGTAWSSGNKTIDGALNVLPDNNDFRFSSANVQGTKQFALDNPRVETLWQYLRRRYNYRTGIVTTSDVTDATPAAQGAHTITRSLGYDIARQYVDGTINPGLQFDVIMGGGLERFNARTATNSGDTRNLITELQTAGFTYLQNRAELNALNSSNAPARVLGLFRTGNMNVAYDKLGLPRPADEPQPNFGGFNNQPFLDEMTAKAIATLNRDNSPFVLMVEGASIDKQSHPNHAAGQIWDNIELDKAVGAGRDYLSRNNQTRSNTLLITTADHDQSLVIIGLTDTTVANSDQNVRSPETYPNPGRLPGESEGFPDYADTNGDRYPENVNRFKIMVGYRTGNHTGSSVPISAEGAGALLFFGHYDQTDLFFKMAKSLSMNTNALDSALRQKLSVDVPLFNPNFEQRDANKFANTNKNIIMLPRTPLRTARILTESDDHGHGEDERRQEKIDTEKP